MNKELSTYQEGEENVKISHFTRKGYDIKGVVHVGANDWYEYPQYMKMGIEHVIGFEPLPEAVERFGNKHPEAKGSLFPIGILNYDGEASLNVAPGDGQSSSVLNMTEEYLQQFPDLKPIGRIKIPVQKFTSWLDKHPEIDMSNFNCLVVDVEGKELEVLRSFGEFIYGFEFLNIELSDEPTYYYGPMAKTVIKWLKKKGFIQDSPVEPHNDVMFIRKDLL